MNGQLNQVLAIRLHKAVDEVLQAGVPETKRPASGGKCAAVWDQLDRMVQTGRAPSLSEIQKVAKRKHWNENNTRVEFYRWRQATGQSASR